MGYRMSIYPEGKPNEYVGDDHKFYGYEDFNTVKQSFTYLYPFIIDQNGTYDLGGCKIMSKAYQCDRCGAFYAPIQHDNEYAKKV